jgi:hypothetical protein
MLMKNYYNLQIPVKILKDNIDPKHFYELDQKKRLYSWALNLVNSKDFLTDECIDFFNQNRVNVLTQCILFRGKPSNSVKIHIDTIDNIKHNIWAINLAWGSTSSEMLWYSPLPGVKNKTNQSTGGTPYIEFDQAQVKEIERTVITGPCLVRTDIPHSVVNYDPDNIRWCISIRGTPNVSSWEDAVKFFNPLITK